MSSLYPSTLFHFTQKKWLFKILTDTFQVSYARENISGPKNDRKLAVPMVSFCDIKLAEIKHFIDKEYGYFGIGLTKEWANRNGLNPVMYMNKNCDLTDNFIDGINGIYSMLYKLKEPSDYDSLSKSYHNILNIYRYVKNYDGELIRGEKTVDLNYRFADEREWRYVPPLDTPGVEPFVAISNIKTKKEKDKYNQKVSHIKLSFQPDDIKYLIVEKDSDINELIDHLDYAKSRFSPTILKRLASRILTVEQIKEDI
jgi:hypothetical protein